MASLPIGWRGAQEFHNVSGTLVIRRQVTFTNAGFGAAFAEIDFRSADWFGASPWLDDYGFTAADAIARGILKGISAIRKTTSVGTSVDFTDAGLVPGDNFNTVDAGNGINWLYPATSCRSRIWAQTSNDGDVICDFDVYFDIPTAP